MRKIWRFWISKCSPRLIAKRMFMVNLPQLLTELVFRAVLSVLWIRSEEGWSVPDPNGIIIILLQELLRIKLRDNVLAKKYWEKKTKKLQLTRGLINNCIGCHSFCLPRGLSKRTLYVCKPTNSFNVDPK